MKATLYARVSTDEQAGNYSLPTQLEACQRYAKKHGFEVVGEFADDYTGTVPIEARPEGGKAYAMLAEGEADALIAYRIDRIVRPPEEGDEWDMPILDTRPGKAGQGIAHLRPWAVKHLVC
jgi:DNA invertase Pin-like site-specific DNA recombinase